MAVQQEVVLAGKFLTESLTNYESTIMETVYPEYWGYEGKYHQAIADLPFGALSYATARQDFTGRAVNYGGKATTLPLANFGINMDQYKCQVGVLAAEWSWQELRSEEMAKNNPMFPQVDVIQSYRRALERGLREWMHLKTVYGDSQIGFTGLVNNPYVEVIDVTAVANGVTGTGATADTTYEWFRIQSSNFRKTTRLTSEATIAIVSEDIRAALQRRFTQNNDGTPEALLTGRTESPAFRSIRTVNEFSGDITRDADIGNLATLGGVTLPIGDNFDIMMFLDASVEDEVVKHYADIETLDAQLLDDCMTYRQVGLCATSEMIFKQPFRARAYIMRKA